MKNYYHILGLSFESAPEKQLINAAYKALVNYHPDVYKGDKKALNKKILEINEAYEILNDEDKKKVYDEKLKSTKMTNLLTTQTKNLKIKMCLIINLLMKIGKLRC